MVYGEDGTGKSYAAYHAAKKQGFGQIHQVIASNSVFMQRDLRNCLHLSKDRLIEKENLRSILQQMPGKEHLALIFDNVRNPYLLKQLLSLDCPPQIIVTTALRPPAKTAGAVFVEATLWEPDACLRFLNSLYSFTQTGIALPDGLWQSPLALELLAACIYESYDPAAIGSKAIKPGIEQCISYLYQTLEQKEKGHSDSEAYALELLKFSSVLCGDFISFTVLRQLTNLEDEQLKENLYHLERLALVKLSEAHLCINPIVQNAVLLCMGQAQADAHIKSVLLQIEKEFEMIHLLTGKLQDGNEWRAHADTLLSDHFTEDAADSPLYAKLCLLSGKYDFASGEYASAKRLLQKAKKSACPSSNWLRQSAMVEIARILEEENNNDGVIEEITQLHAESPSLAQDFPALEIESLIIASQAYENQGAYARANILLKKGLALLEKSPDSLAGLQDEKKIFLFNGIGKAYSSRHRYRKAIHVYDQGLALCKTGNNFQAAFLYSNKGCALYHLKKYQSAEEYMQKSRKIYASALHDGPTRDKLDNLICLATLYTRMEGKEDLLKECLSSIRTNIQESGQKYSDIDIYLYNCDGVHQYQKGRLDDALAAFEKGIALCEQSNTADHSAIFPYLLANKAQTLYEQKNPAMALEELRFALKACKNSKHMRFQMAIRYLKMLIKYSIYHKK